MQVANDFIDVDEQFPENLRNSKGDELAPA
jgi:hypothetical protein